MKKFIFVVVSILIACIVFAIVFFCILFPLRYRSEIGKYAKEFGLSESFVASVINVESRYDSSAVSSVGAVGLMQILPSTARECAQKLGIEFDDVDLYDADENIRIGCFYLHYLLELFDGNIVNVLCAYNWGLGNVNNWIALGYMDSDGTITNIPIEETRNYIKKFYISSFVYEKLYGL
jgi:soluble lytic murein transglycosylase